MHCFRSPCFKTCACALRCVVLHADEMSSLFLSVERRSSRALLRASGMHLFCNTLNFVQVEGALTRLLKPLPLALSCPQLCALSLLQ